MTLTEFLLARIAEDRAEMGEWHSYDCAINSPIRFPCDCTVPARVLAECEAKRSIVEEAQRAQQLDAPGDDLRAAGYFGAMEVVLAALAAVYADHPDYNEAWRL